MYPITSSHIHLEYSNQFFSCLHPSNPCRSHLRSYLESTFVILNFVNQFFGAWVVLILLLPFLNTLRGCCQGCQHLEHPTVQIQVLGVESPVLCYVKCLHTSKSHLRKLASLLFFLLICLNLNSQIWYRHHFFVLYFVKQLEQIGPGAEVSKGPKWYRNRKKTACAQDHFFIQLYLPLIANSEMLYFSFPQ